MSRRSRAVLAAAVVVCSIGWWAGPSAGADPVPPMQGAATATQRAIRGERVDVAPPTDPPTTQRPANPITDPLLQAVFDLTNAERAAHGLPALTWNAQLTQAAQGHSEDQARRNTLTHYGPNGEDPGDRVAATGYLFRTWAENAAMGYRTAETVMVGWMNSPGHRANILRASVTEIGLGIAYSEHGIPYWTQVFASPRT